MGREARSKSTSAGPRRARNMIAVSPWRAATQRTLMATSWPIGLFQGSGPLYASAPHLDAHNCRFHIHSPDEAMRCARNRCTHANPVAAVIGALSSSSCQAVPASHDSSAGVIVIAPIQLLVEDNKARRGPVRAPIHACFYSLLLWYLRPPTISPLG